MRMMCMVLESIHDSRSMMASYEYVRSKPPRRVRALVAEDLLLTVGPLRV